jgi:uncharacterized caspase-like protein
MPSTSPLPILARATRVAVAVAGLLLGPAVATNSVHAQAVPAARVADAERIHALVIGIDAYRHVPRLKGAVADARDIEASLRTLGVADISVLLDDAADRSSILAAVESLRARLRPGDLVILSVAGHGAQEPEHVRGSASDGKNEVFLLAGFDTASGATTQRILDMEFKHFIKQFESAGARVLFVADTCSGGGLARDVDPRAGEMIYRAVPTYRITDDELKPVATPADAFTTELDFERTIFLAAADRNTKAPEIQVRGINGYRGALSYAFARGLQGSADGDGDGTIVVKELFDYVHDLTYQLSDQRQNIVSASAPSLASEPIVRSVTVVGQRAKDPDPSFPAAVASSREPPVRVAILGGDASKLAGVKPIETPFEVVPLSEKADLIWDARTGDVIGGGDVVARTVAASELPSVIDRTAAVRALKQIATRSVQPIRLVPNSRVHHRGSRVEVEVDALAGRSLILFNIAGDGTVQLIYPTGNDPKLMESTSFQLPIEVREPFGSDQIVAVTTSRRNPDLELALVRSSDRRTSAQVLNRLARANDPSLRVGSVGVFTAP